MSTTSPVAASVALTLYMPKGVLGVDISGHLQSVMVYSPLAFVLPCPIPTSEVEGL